MRNLNAALLSMVVFFMLTSTASAWTDVGAVDYYRATKQEGKLLKQEMVEVEKQKKEAMKSRGDGNGRNTKLKVIEEEKKKKQLLRLIKKYTPTGQPAILKGQPFSVNLSTSFIGKFREIGKKGEVAIVARIAERGAAASGFKFGADAADSGRLIYFSNDVQEKQSHNFSYIPVYGPIIYHGQPLDVQLYVIEIDHVEQFKPLLHSLAKAGQALYPPASPVIGVLDSLGSALLSAAKNDKMFEYTFSLWPKSPGGQSAGFQLGEYPVLEAGHYVFMRQQDRQNVSANTPDTVYVDPGDHKLKRVVPDKKNKGKETVELYTDDSYLVLHVKRETFALSMEQENNFYQTLSDFKKAEAKSSVADVQKVADALEGLGNGFVRAKRVKDVYGLYQAVGAASSGQEANAQTNAAKLVTRLHEQIKLREACPTAEGCDSVMSKEEIVELLALMRATQAFSGVTSNLTYAALLPDNPQRDTQIVKSVGEMVKTIAP